MMTLRERQQAIQQRYQQLNQAIAQAQQQMAAWVEERAHLSGQLFLLDELLAETPEDAPADAD